MSRHTNTEINCDYCGKILLTNCRSLAITFEQESFGTYWDRLKIKIEHHNNYEIDNADLCQECTIHLLIETLRRVREGERTSSGEGSINKRGWGI